MSELITNDFQSASELTEASVGSLAEQQRTTAEVQAALMIAQARPRDEKKSMDRVLNACQRVGVAQKAEYSYARGGTDIAGPTIQLLTVIANAWGNLHFGFRELSQSQGNRHGESTVETFAWDLETNTKRTVVFQVPHVRYTRSGATPLRDPRDIYEMIANQAQRRVRACLESVIPGDVIDSARDQCNATLKAKDPVTPEKIKAMAEAFTKDFSVTKAQIEARIQRKLETMTSAQLIGLRKIYMSLKDGMSVASDWFAGEEASEAKPKSKGVAGLREKIETEEQSESLSYEELQAAVDAATDRKSLVTVKSQVTESTLTEPVRVSLLESIDDRLAILDAQA